MYPPHGKNNIADWPTWIFVVVNLVMGFAIIAASVPLKACSRPITKKHEMTHVNAKLSPYGSAEGLTVEQKNIKARLAQENKPDVIRHLYVISPYSGRVLIHSTVKGKVASSGKRLTPSTVLATEHYADSLSGLKTKIRGESHFTTEVMGEDGTYGSSGPYIYWLDDQNQYHQHFVTGGQIIHVTDQPLPVEEIAIDMAASN